MAGGFRAGGVPQGQRGGQCGLLFRQLPGQLLGLPGGTQLLLHGFQLKFGGAQGVSGSGLLGLLTFQQCFQKLQSGLRGSLGAQGVQRCRVRIVCGVQDAGEQAVQLGVLGQALLVQPGVFLLQAHLQLLIALGAEQPAEDAAPVLGGSVQQLGELSLRNEHDLGKLIVIQPDDLLHGGSDLFGLGDGRTPVGVGQDGIGLFGGSALAPDLGPGVFRVAPHGIAGTVHLKFQFHKGGRFGVGVFAPEHGAFPHAAAGVVVQGIGDGVE